MTQMHLLDEPYRKKPAPSEIIPATVVAEWLREHFPGVPAMVVERELGFRDGFVRKVLRGEAKTVCITVLDEAFTSVGRPDLLEVFFP